MNRKGLYSLRALWQQKTSCHWPLLCGVLYLCTPLWQGIWCICLPMLCWIYSLWFSKIIEVFQFRGATLSEAFLSTILLLGVCSIVQQCEQILLICLQKLSLLPISCCYFSPVLSLIVIAASQPLTTKHVHVCDVTLLPNILGYIGGLEIAVLFLFIASINGDIFSFVHLQRWLVFYLEWNWLIKFGEFIFRQDISNSNG